MIEAKYTAQNFDWDSPWLDGLAFFAGLGMAWYWGWETKELIWSLWVSSLVVGFAMIAWGVVTRMVKTKAMMGGLLLLGFLGLHFGLFHFIHSILLNSLFPIAGEAGVPSLGTYGQLLAGLWWFLPAAFIAERSGFIHTGETALGHPINVIADAGAGFMKPYRNVFRMHVMIFFFILANWMKLENIAVYAVVYAVYFFPWRRLKQEETG